MSKEVKWWKQGQYIVKNKEKYIGVSEPIYRSSWEERFCYFLDHNKNVIRWCSECVKIPYVFRGDGHTHNYYPDFYCEIIVKRKLKKYIIEIKPEKQTHAPKKPKRPKSNKTYIYEMVTWIKNQDKWRFTEDYCKRRGITFRILTEKTLF